eukprot:4022898-Heterocapsa_arctica.AAC.1
MSWDPCFPDSDSIGLIMLQLPLRQDNRPLNSASGLVPFLPRTKVVDGPMDRIRSEPRLRLGLPFPVGRPIKPATQPAATKNA